MNIIVNYSLQCPGMQVEYGADPTTRDDNGVTPFEYAATGRMKALIREWRASSRNIPEGGNETC